MKIFSTENWKNAPVVIWGDAGFENEGGQRLFEEVQKISKKDFSLVIFEIEDWNRQLSPWKADAVFGKEKFLGDGKKTLEMLEKKLLPELKIKFCGSEFFIAGYSLAGLFSLWTMYESEIFDGAVCCSSSLWFEKWDEYVRKNKIKKPSKIYLSLGDGEENAKNKIMAKVGERTRNQFEILKLDENVCKVNFEWNEGGHFNEVLKRLAKGICWILEN